MFRVNLPGVACPDFQTYGGVLAWIDNLHLGMDDHVRYIDAVESTFINADGQTESVRLPVFLKQSEPTATDDTEPARPARHIGGSIRPFVERVKLPDDHATLEKMVDLLKDIVKTQEGLTEMVRGLVDIVKVQAAALERLQNGSSRE